jgi:FkbM family methyltransferase
MKNLSHAFWVFANWYGAVFGRSFLTPLHHFFLNLSLHGLGYDNARHTGEEWFVTHILTGTPIKTCIDIGANVGAYSILLAQNLTCPIYAIEPSASSFKELEQVSKGHAGHIIPINIAVSNQDGVATLFSRNEKSEKASLLLSPGEIVSVKEEVRVTTLDSLIREHKILNADFIKIDTEGHEKEVLSGMKETLSILQPKYIQFEFNRTHLYRNITLFALSELLRGYEFYRLLPHGWIKIDPLKQADNIFMFSNIIAKRIS